jgi:phospholipase D1/2
VASYALGRALSRAPVRRLAGRLLRRMSPRLARRSVRAVATGRMVPVAPFAVVTLLAGASGVDFRSFALRTIVSVTAGTALLVLLTSQIADAVRYPGARTLGGLIGATVLLLLFGPLGRRRHWDPAEWVQHGRDRG